MLFTLIATLLLQTDPTSSLVTNASHKTVHLDFTATGCTFQSPSGIAHVCGSNDLGPGESVTFTWPPNTQPAAIFAYDGHISGQGPASASQYLTDSGNDFAWQPGTAPTLAPATPALFVNKASGRCLDVDYFDGALGRALHLYHCDGGLDQAFGFFVANALTGHLIDTKSGLCLGVSGAAPQIVTCTAGFERTWTLTATTGWTTVINGQGLCLTAVARSDGSFPDGADLKLQTCTNAESQLWAPLSYPH